MDRRLFLTAGVGTGVIAMSQPLAPHAAAAEASVAGLTKANIPTPALVVDLDALEANLQKMADHCRAAKCGFRPHAKTHKCPEIARRQMAAGALGISVATVAEAEAMATAKIDGILLTSPIVDPAKIARMVALARNGTKLMLAVGHMAEAELLSQAVDAADVRLDVLVDLDVGDKRTGVLPGEPALELARKISARGNLRVRGVQAYAGHASHTVGFEARQRVSRTAMTKAVETRRLLEKSGFDAPIVSGGSTGTYNIDSAIDGVTELQVGSYVFMDLDYRRIGGQDGAAAYRDFQHSLTVLATVVSAAHADRVTVDAGTKAIDTTTPHAAEAKDRPGLVYNRSGDEFGAVTAQDGAKLPKLGERLEFLVPHCDPSVNLYDRLYACRGERVEAIWPIAARRDDRPGLSP
jgi:D-serine deaminase-like pyridoxal phosphate-dependent protein